MKIDVKVIPSARKNLVKEEGAVIKVYLTAPPEDGKANRMLLQVLADHFGVPERRIQILKGLKSRWKSINIDI